MFFFIKISLKASFFKKQNKNLFLNLHLYAPASIEFAMIQGNEVKLARVFYKFLIDFNFVANIDLFL